MAMGEVRTALVSSSELITLIFCMIGDKGNSVSSRELITEMIRYGYAHSIRTKWITTFCIRGDRVQLLVMS